MVWHHGEISRKDSSYSPTLADLQRLTIYYVGTQDIVFGKVDW